MSPTSANSSVFTKVPELPIRWSFSMVMPEVRPVASFATEFDSFLMYTLSLHDALPILYLPVAVSLCSQVQVADSPGARDALPPAMVVQFVSVKLLSEIGRAHV